MKEETIKAISIFIIGLIIGASSCILIEEYSYKLNLHGAPGEFEYRCQSDYAEGVCNGMLWESLNQNQWKKCIRNHCEILKDE